MTPLLPHKKHFHVLLGCLALILSMLPGCRSPLSTGRGAQPANASGLPATFIVEHDPEPMVLVPAGYFQMGSDQGNGDEQPAHRVYLDDFYIDIAEVTCKRYARFLQDTGHPPHRLWAPEFDRPDDPVVGVSWYDAAAFAEWAGKELPTEAEWEKAARGGLVEKNYPWGNDIDREKANYDSFGTTPVKSYEPNGYGLHDVAGNVWEWCRDWYGDDYYTMSPGHNPPGPQRGERKVVRGGGWYNHETALRVSNRYSNNPLTGNFNTGFRCVKSAQDIN